MPYNAEPGDVAYVVFSKACAHGDLVTEQGFVGAAVKTQTPAADAVRTSRNQIAVSEAGLLLISKIVEASSAGPLAGVTKGALVYILAADNTLSLAAGAGKLVVGRVCSLPSERGTPSTKVRINLRQKV